MHDSLSSKEAEDTILAKANEILLDRLIKNPLCDSVAAARIVAAAIIMTGDKIALKLDAIESRLKNINQDMPTQG